MLKKYFTGVTQAVLDLRMIPQKLKRKLLQLLKKHKCCKDVIYLICSLHEIALICFFNHTKKTQPISTIFFLPDVSFNCQHRKQSWILYILVAFYPSKNTLYFPVMPTNENVSIPLKQVSTPSDKFAFNDELDKASNPSVPACPVHLWNLGGVLPE